MYDNLLNQTAVVTGAGAGIGKAIAIRLANEGLKVAVADVNIESGEETAKLIRDNDKSACFIYINVTDEESIKLCMESANKWGGNRGIRVLVNNAAAFIFGHLGGAGSGSGTFTDRNISMNDWTKVLNTNVVGYAKYKCIEHVVPYMKSNELTKTSYNINQGEGNNFINAGSRGSIINIASTSSFIAQPEFVPYNASKAAIIQITRCTAMDLSKFKIRVNAVAPGTVETPASYNHMRLINLSIEDGRKKFAESNLLKRQAAPEEIANGVFFLASDQSSFMTGSVIMMDGGETID